MHHRTKLMITALTATMLLAVNIGSASAGRFSVNEKNWEAIWNRAITGKENLTFSAGTGGVVRCPVTLLGSFVERTIKKETLVREAIINHAAIRGGSAAGECEGGTATIRQESLPWEGRYRSFRGTLPRIRGITAGDIGVRFRIRETGGLECEIGTEVNHPGLGIVGESAERAETGLESTGEPENVSAERANGIPLGGGFLCAFGGEGHFSGVGLVLNLPTTRKIKVTLI